MKTEILSIEDPNAILHALIVLKNGGLVAFPTDTVYGVAANPFEAAAIERLYEAKIRETNKAIAVLIGNLDQIPQVASKVTEPAHLLARQFWPGALTLIVPRLASLPDNLSSSSSIGLRMPDHAFALALLQKAGPLATTSANLSGGANTSTTQEVLAQLDGRIELLLDGGKTPGGVPSTVVDCTQPETLILRQGAISAEQIQTALRS
ncbi:MAG: L-threonylcarbamoyladenylate synthase [Anaerolineaceae bacterium]|nr:L-threonylcarbamoyladenylate synthase [Anaerolineaceae bacterium]